MRIPLLSGSGSAPNDRYSRRSGSSRSKLQIFKQLYDEAAGLVRAIMDFQDMEEGKIKIADIDEIAPRDRLEDARRWVKYVKQMKE